MSTLENRPRRTGSDGGTIDEVHDIRLGDPCGVMRMCKQQQFMLQTQEDNQNG